MKNKYLIIDNISYINPSPLLKNSLREIHIIEEEKRGRLQFKNLCKKYDLGITDTTIQKYNNLY